MSLHWENIKVHIGIYAEVPVNSYFGRKANLSSSIHGTLLFDEYSSKLLAFLAWNQVERTNVEQEGQTPADLSYSVPSGRHPLPNHWPAELKIGLLSTDLLNFLYAPTRLYPSFPPCQLRQRLPAGSEATQGTRTPAYNMGRSP